VTSNVDVTVRGFADYLSLAWAPAQTLLTGDRDATDDWLQANWEFLVERTVVAGGFLLPYGDGADCYGESNRVYQPAAIPSHAIVCQPVGPEVKDVLTNQAIRFPANGLILIDLVGPLDGGAYSLAPPFNHARVGDSIGNWFVVSLSNIEFSVRSLAPDE
jgi:hypothetical protein